MQTKVKTKKEIEAMRTSGRLLAAVHATLKEALQPGMTTKDLAEIAKRELRGTGGQPTFLGYYGFPDILCVSVNDEVVHGIPGVRIIEPGDLVSMDFGVTYDGMITDASITAIAGKPNGQEDEALVKQTKLSLEAGIQAIKDGVCVGDIASAVQAVLDKGKYGIVRDLVGHGVGHELHEDPNIPNFGKAGTGPQLKAGMTIAIEPMATLGGHEVYTDNDGWTIRTRDGSMAAHFEHTVLITHNGVEILTNLR
ncbi:type I methionyl aminopeptidase [soil metagenome]